MAASSPWIAGQPGSLSGTVYGALLNHRPQWDAIGDAAHRAPYGSPPIAHATSPLLETAPADDHRRWLCDSTRLGATGTARRSHHQGPKDRPHVARHANGQPDHRARLRPADGRHVFILGGLRVRPTDIDLRWVGAILKKNGIVEETGLAAGVLDHPAHAVAWLANKIAPHGERLNAGDVVLAGSFTRPTGAVTGDGFEVDYGALGMISFRFS